MENKKKVIAVVIAAILIVAGVLLVFNLVGSEDDVREITIYDVLDHTSTRNPVEDTVVISDLEPALALVATPLACWYHIGGSGTDGPEAMYGLKPFLVMKDGGFTTPQERFLCRVFTGLVNRQV